jgi:hypothetical protein
MRYFTIYCAYDVFRYEGGQEINKHVLDNMMTFARKQKGGVIDVWWLYDDGGKSNVAYRK